MYRYNVDNALTYTPEDVILFRESPFACWMERLTFENPDHGIDPDTGASPFADMTERQDELADTLRDEGKDVHLIDWEADELDRRVATDEAMRRGADFIVNSQLSVGPISAAGNMLVRTSGYSELGDFLYIPCSAQAASSRHSAFRLALLADLLHSVQGQLPPQMLIIRGGHDLEQLPTDHHIHCYRAVRQRFLEFMSCFRKHRMPNPVASSHFGRWSDCAHELLKRQALRAESRLEESTAGEFVEPLRAVAGTVPNSDAVAYIAEDSDRSVQQEQEGAGPGTRISLTLVEQARLLKPGTYKPGPGEYRLGRPVEAAGSRPSAADEDHAGDESVEPLPSHASLSSRKQARTS